MEKNRPTHKHEFVPFAVGKYHINKRTNKGVMDSFYVACLCGAIKTIKVKTINGVKYEKVAV